MGKFGIMELVVILAVIAIIFFALRVLILWYYKIDERITQQHETNRLLRKLAGEPEINSPYLNSARSNANPVVSTGATAQKPKHD